MDPKVRVEEERGYPFAKVDECVALDDSTYLDKSLRIHAP